MLVAVNINDRPCIDDLIFNAAVKQRACRKINCTSLTAFLNIKALPKRFIYDDEDMPRGFSETLLEGEYYERQ